MSGTLSPRSMAARACVLEPTACTTMVMVRATGSAWAIVRGTRSPRSEARTTTNCPTARLVAMRGAWMTSRYTFPASCSFFRTSNMVAAYLVWSCRARRQMRWTSPRSRPARASASCASSMPAGVPMS